MEEAFVYIAFHPYADLNVDSAHFQLLEQCTVIYDKTSHHQYLNEARQELFCQKEKSMDRLPGYFAITCKACCLSGWSLVHL